MDRKPGTKRKPMTPAKALKALLAYAIMDEWDMDHLGEVAVRDARAALALAECRVVFAVWDAESGRYVVDPSHNDCDMGENGSMGWVSADGDLWLNNGSATETPGGDFDSVAIMLFGGPRKGETVA